MYAAFHGHTEVVSLLLDRGADLEAKDNVGMLFQSRVPLCPSRKAAWEKAGESAPGTIVALGVPTCIQGWFSVLYCFESLAGATQEGFDAERVCGDPQCRTMIGNCEAIQRWLRRRQLAAWRLGFSNSRVPLPTRASEPAAEL